MRVPSFFLFCCVAWRGWTARHREAHTLACPLLFLSIQLSPRLRLRGSSSCTGLELPSIPSCVFRRLVALPCRRHARSRWARGIEHRPVVIDKGRGRGSVGVVFLACTGVVCHARAPGSRVFIAWPVIPASSPDSLLGPAPNASPTTEVALRECRPRAGAGARRTTTSRAYSLFLLFSLQTRRGARGARPPAPGSRPRGRSS